MPRIVNTNQHASPDLDGLAWTFEDGRLVSPELSQERAARYLSIEGFEPFEKEEKQGEQTTAPADTSVQTQVPPTGLLPEGPVDPNAPEAPKPGGVTSEIPPAGEEPQREAPVTDGSGTDDNGQGDGAEGEGDEDPAGEGGDATGEGTGEEAPAAPRRRGRPPATPKT